jgi:hypothetical protein
MTTASQTAAINITCPPWCTISAEAHLTDLDNQEGRCIHHSAETEDGWGLVSITTPDGQLWADPGYRGVELWDGGDCITLDEAEQRARSILALVQEGRR